jgi:hypothetical protein
MRQLSTKVASLLAVALLAISGRSSATGLAPRLHVDWGSLTRALEALHVEPLTSAESPSTPPRARVVTTEQGPWLETPTAVLSVVARDWEGASHLAGGPLSSSDAIRVSKSARMLVGRVAADLGRVAPFAHLGVGQWRTPDPHVIGPPTPYAAQVGVGVEVSLFEGCGLAVEYDWTGMYLESHRDEAVAVRYLGWGEAFAAVRWNFETTAAGAAAR